MEQFPQSAMASKKPELSNEKGESQDLCPHGISRESVCQLCVHQSQEGQPVWKMLESINADSKYKRSMMSPESTVERDGMKFELQLVQAEDEKTVQEVQQLMEETFGKEEVDPIEVLREAIKGTPSVGSEDVTRYRIYVARDENGIIQSLYAGGLVDMNDAQGKPLGEKMFMAAYGVTREESRKRGIARELYVSSMMQAAADAYADGKKLSMIISECTSTSEKAWNAIGRRRAYVQTGANDWTELKYVQPPLDWDPDTGMPAEDAGNAAEHIMMQPFDGDMTKERLSSALDAIYRWNNYRSEKFFHNPEAQKAHFAYIQAIQKQFDSELNAGGELKLLSASEREEMIKKGAVIHEYTEADEEGEESDND